MSYRAHKIKVYLVYTIHNLIMFYFIIGENALFVPTFWVNFHFGPKIDFFAKKKKKKKSFLK